MLRDAVVDAQQTGWRSDQATDSVALGCGALVHGSAGLWREAWLGAQFPDTAMSELLRATLLGAL